MKRSEKEPRVFARGSIFILQTSYCILFTALINARTEAVMISS